MIRINCYRFWSSLRISGYSCFSGYMYFFGKGFHMTRPGNAAVLSLIIPGLGQFYNGHFWRGIFWLIVTPGLWIGSGGFLGWICHVIAAVTAYQKADQ